MVTLLGELLWGNVPMRSQTRIGRAMVVVAAALLVSGPTMSAYGAARHHHHHHHQHHHNNKEPQPTCGAGPEAGTNAGPVSAPSSCPAPSGPSCAIQPNPAFLTLIGNFAATETCVGLPPLAPISLSVASASACQGGVDINGATPPVVEDADAEGQAHFSLAGFNCVPGTFATFGTSIFGSPSSLFAELDLLEEAGNL